MLCLLTLSSMVTMFNTLKHIPGARSLHSLQSILPQPFHVPSPLATSSKFTLDHPLHAPLPYTLPRIPPSDRSDPALPALLSYASDDELVNSLHSASTKTASMNPFSLSVDWTSTIDPALAYLSLRSRSSFTPFLTDRSMARNVKDTYEALRPSGLHQRLVSDLLLRNPDPRTLATILELDALSIKLNSFDNLRSSLVVSIYDHLPDRWRDGLSRTTHLRVARAMINQGETDSVPAVFHNLYASTHWEPEGVWVLLSLISHLSRHQAVEEALPLLQHLLRHNRLPQAALPKTGRGDSTHPHAPAITVISILIRTTLSYGLYGRSRLLATDLISLLVNTPHHEPAWDLLLELCRTSLVGGTKDEKDFVNTTLSAMSRFPQSPILPKATINDFVASNKPRRAAGFYFSLDEAKRPDLTAGNVLRLASLREPRIFAKLDLETSKLKAADWEQIQEAYETYRTTLSGRRWHLTRRSTPQVRA